MGRYHEVGEPQKSKSNAGQWAEVGGKWSKRTPGESAEDWARRGVEDKTAEDAQRLGSTVPRRKGESDEDHRKRTEEAARLMDEADARRGAAGARSESPQDEARRRQAEAQEDAKRADEDDAEHKKRVASNVGRRAEEVKRRAEEAAQAAKRRETAPRGAERATADARRRGDELTAATPRDMPNQREHETPWTHGEQPARVITVRGTQPTVESEVACKARHDEAVDAWKKRYPEDQDEPPQEVDPDTGLVLPPGAQPKSKTPVPKGASAPHLIDPHGHTPRGAGSSPQSGPKTPVTTTHEGASVPSKPTPKPTPTNQPKPNPTPKPPPK